MDVLRRYDTTTSYIDKRGNQVSRRYKRVDKDFSFNLIETDKPTTFDIMSLTYYGTPVMYWLIADFNDYLDPTVTIPSGTKLKIPVIK